MNRTASTYSPQDTPSPAWWRLRMVWLVIGGPAVVVLASFVTLYLAVSHPDPVLPTLPVATADGDDATKADSNKAAALLPALVGRNHAATAGSPR